MVASQAGGPPETLETGELVLRRHRVDDAAAIAEAVADSLDELRPWMPWADDRSATEEFQRHRLEQEADLWERGLAYTYLIFAQGGDRLLGVVGLHRRVGPDALEVGYWLRTGETGKGVMTAAVRAVVAAALALPGMRAVELRCDETNHASAAVARRLGFSLRSIERRPPEAPGETGRQMIWVTAGLPG